MKPRKKLRILIIRLFISIVFSMITLTENKILLRKKAVIKNNQSFPIGT